MMPGTDTRNGASAPELKVLLVEDNPADARLVREMLKDAHRPVSLTHASRLRDALEHLRTQGYNAILLDLNLPDSEGMSTFLRARAEASQAPIVVLTGLADEEVAARAVREGAQDYLVKAEVDGPLLYRSIRYAVERHAADEAIRRSEALYRNLVEGSIQGVMIHVDGLIKRANQALASMLGLERADDLLEQPVWQFIAPQDREMSQAYAKARREGRPAPSNFELHLLKRDGSVILVDCMASSIPWEGGQATLATVVDMTERKRAELGLRASEERFRQIAENIKEAFLVVELDGYRPLYLSRMCEEIWGRPLEEAYRSPHSWVQAIHPDDAAIVIDTRQAIEKGVPVSRNFRIVRPDGTIRWVRARAFPVRNASREIYRVVGLVEDITDVRRTEEQLLQAQKMEAVGRLAGGVAHDFNNLLTAILGYSELVLQDLGPDHPSALDVREIRAAGQSAENLTRQLLAFSRRQILQPQTLDLNAVLKRVDALLQRIIGEDIDLTMKLTAPLGRVSADPGQIEQVVLNLAVNARDAMPHGGKLTIETANVMLDDDYVSQHAGATTGPHVMVAVTDNGTGMDTATQQRLFEPFFTTKEPGRGTGLGLATVYGIVTQSRGSIWVYSELGQGSTFKVYLPVTTEEVAPVAPVELSPAALSGTETVLVVEDQIEARSVICETLRRRGYTVIEAINGPDAIVKGRQPETAIDVMLTDVVMPGMGGRRVAEVIRATRPHLRVVYMSGYTDSAIVDHGILEPGVTFVQKPFATDTLLRKIREVLDAL
jgi:two-component system, cell cycle sensor histidine kinase and response regulator CckA